MIVYAQWLGNPKGLTVPGLEVAVLFMMFLRSAHGTSGELKLVFTPPRPHAPAHTWCPLIELTFRPISLFFRVAFFCLRVVILNIGHLDV